MSLAASLDRLERNPLNHLRLGMMGTVLDAARLVELSGGSLEQHPFIVQFLGEATRLAGDRVPDREEWRSAVAGWAKAEDRLPIERLRASGFSDQAIEILLALAFCEQDGRLAELFGEESYLSVAAIDALCERKGGEDVTVEIARLAELGLARLQNPNAPRYAWRYAIAPELLDGLSGTVRTAAGLALVPVELLPDAADFVPPQPGFPNIAAIADLLRDAGSFLCIRGPARNGRHMLAACAAKSLGRPLLTADANALSRPETRSAAAIVGCLTGAILAVEAPLGAGENLEIPGLPFGDRRLIVITGRSGGIRMPEGEPSVTIELPPPSREARAELWRRSAGIAAELAQHLSRAFRLTSGNLVSVAKSAALAARIAPEGTLQPGLVQASARALHDSRLEAIARRLEASPEADLLMLDGIAMDELAGLLARCRNREELSLDAATGNAGVRALFAGPSGTGKTLSARWLAARLDKDIYRLDLAACVNKYIGETEKALDRAFCAAEDLDCILLIDEGDALMARRTDVGGANDRYANLETNFLLQRIEAFDAILIVTTNAPDRIDKAFGRRMDVVVQFHAPDEAGRHAILNAHLGAHQVSGHLLEEIACRCNLTGGQLRNLALHARLLALDSDRELKDEHLRAALVREYRKIDAHCPLKPQLAEAG